MFYVFVGTCLTAFQFKRKRSMCVSCRGLLPDPRGSRNTFGLMFNE